jgi:hypothetical protein
MLNSQSMRPALLGMACAFALTYSLASVADDMVSFSTGGYARGLRTKEMMHKIDTDGDGTISHDEYITYQLKIFDMMDTSAAHKGSIGPQEMFATGGANRR